MEISVIYPYTFDFDYTADEKLQMLYNSFSYIKSNIEWKVKTSKQLRMILYLVKSSYE